MAKFLTTNEVTSEIAKIINKAKPKTRVTLISPYVQIPENLLQDMKDACSRNVSITLIYGKEELKPEVRSHLEQLDNLSLRFLDNLHAKCFFNEDCMVITSLNLYNYSEKNREMGVLINAKDDADLFNEAAEEAKKIVKLAKEIKLGSSLLEKVGEKIDKGIKSAVDSLIGEEPGHCIGCGRDMIPYNKDRPICGDCWKLGVRQGRFCYRCREERKTTQKRPLCDSCYHKS
jgi:hypothetical protein